MFQLLVDMTAKEFLKQYEYADRRVRRLEEEYNDEMLMVDAIRSSSDNDGMPHGTNISNPTLDKAMRLNDKRQRLVEAKVDAIEARQKVFDMIDGIEGVEGDVLFERYVKLRKWEEICVIIHYSWQGTHLIHRRALAIVDSRLK